MSIINLYGILQKPHERRTLAAINHITGLPYEQIIQCNLLIDILRMFVMCYTVCRDHYQLDGMGLRVLLAMEEGINLVGQL